MTLLFQYDGAENDDQTPYLIDLVNQGSVIIPDFDISIPERYVVPNQRELLYVPGSNVVTMFLWGKCRGAFLRGSVRGVWGYFDTVKLVHLCFNATFVKRLSFQTPKSAFYTVIHLR